MTTRRTYEQKLLDDLTAMPANKWFKCPSPPAYDKFVKAVKEFIDAGNFELEFSNDYTKIKRRSDEWQEPEPYHKRKKLPSGIRIEVINPGETVEIDVKGGKYVHTYDRKHYRIFENDKLLTIE
ncbi:MAG TPA: hypothetical protein VGM63_15185 [Mucilaginibacter sp.]|jgi:hypothetical protein